jgi:hypothetical protein
VAGEESPRFLMKLQRSCINPPSSISLHLLRENVRLRKGGDGKGEVGKIEDGRVSMLPLWLPLCDQPLDEEILLD